MLEERLNNNKVTLIMKDKFYKGIHINIREIDEYKLQINQFQYSKFEN